MLLSFIFAVTLISSAFSSELIKKCNTTISFEGKTQESEITFFKDGDKHTVQMINSGSGFSMPLTDVATVKEFEIRSGLGEDENSESDEYINSLNSGERYILHAMMMTQDGQIEEFLGLLADRNKKDECSTEESGFNSGIDLSKVRHTKVYEVQGNPGDLSRVAVIEARDDKGDLLGSFFGGFFVSLCRP